MYTTQRVGVKYAPMKLITTIKAINISITSLLLYCFCVVRLFNISAPLSAHFLIYKYY